MDYREDGDYIWKDGKKYLRVTAAIRHLSDFSAIPETTLENKKRIGTLVHKYIEEDSTGGFPVIESDCQGYFDSYCRWRDEVKPEYESNFCERRYFNEDHMFTGKIDAVAKVGEGAILPQLVDFKCTYAEHKRTWSLQAHAYNILVCGDGAILGAEFLFVKLDKLGKLPKVFRYNWNRDTQNEYLSYVEAHWDKHEKDVNTR